MAVERGALTSNCSEALAAQRIVNQADDLCAAVLERDGDVKLWLAVGEIDRAVERIDDPAVFTLRNFNFRFFFGQDRMAGKVSL